MHFLLLNGSTTHDPINSDVTNNHNQAREVMAYNIDDDDKFLILRWLPNTCVRLINVFKAIADKRGSPDDKRTQPKTLKQTNKAKYMYSKIFYTYWETMKVATLREWTVCPQNGIW